MAINNQYEGKNAEQVWNEWDEKQREHFLYDHIDQTGMKSLRDRLDTSDKSYKDLPHEVKEAIGAHIKMEQYKTGGMAGGGVSDEKFPKQYGSMSSAQRAIDKYEAKHGKQRFSINKIDDGSYEVELHQRRKGSMAGGGRLGNLEKELHKLQRDLNSSRLQTYVKGDNSEEEMARQRERAVKLARFNEVLRLLNEKEMSSSGSMAKGGKIQLHDKIKFKFKDEIKEGSIKGGYKIDDVFTVYTVQDAEGSYYDIATEDIVERLAKGGIIESVENFFTGKTSLKEIFGYK